MAAGVDQVQEWSLAAFLQGKLSLQDFEWPQHLRPTLPFNTFLESHLIPEIDLQALLSCSAADGALRGTISPPLSLLSPNGKLDDNNGSSVVKHVSAMSTLPAGSSACDYQRAVLLKAATSCGFFQVHNHSIPIPALETLNSYARIFFSMPVEHKLEIAKQLGSLIAGFNYLSGYMGGSPVDSPNKCMCEALRIASFDKSSISVVAQCLWPKEADQQAFNDALEECSKGFKKVSEQLALILLQELDIDAEEVLNEYVRGEQRGGVKLNHYPAWPQPDKTLGLPVHTDVSLLTLLWQDDVGGLQVQRDGQWINVKPRRDAIVVNIGDILQVWSNDRYKSGLHQAVLNSSQSRQSIAFFYNSSGDSTLAPLPHLLNKSGEPPKFRSIQTSEYRRYVFSRVFQDEWQGVEYLRC